MKLTQARPWTVGAAMALALCVLAPAGLAGQDAQQPGRNQPARDTSARPEQPAGTASITGRVVAADSGRPVKRARVVAAPGGRSATTNDQGRYELVELPAARYTLTASKTGFVSITFGQRRPLQPGTPVELADGQRLQGVDFRLPRGSVITGHVLDEDGEPLARAVVNAMRYAYQQGERRLVPAGTDQTDDRGEFRVFGLPPGDYVVSASARFLENLGLIRRAIADAVGVGPGPGGGGLGPGPGGGGLGRWAGLVPDAEPEAETLGYGPTYYPGATDLAQATRLTLGVGQELANVDFAIQLVPTARIGGVVIGPDGTAAVGTNVAVTSDAAPGLRLGSTFSARVQNDGSFSVVNVPPGRYVVSARAGRRNDDGALFATQTVTVAGQDVFGLTLMLMPGAAISGSVSFESSRAAPPSDFTRIRVNTSPLEPGPLGGGQTGRVRDDGTFLVENLPPGRHLVRAGGATRDWSVKGIYLDGRDVTDVPLELGTGQTVTGVTIAFTDRITDLSGVVVDEANRPAREFTVIAFASDAALWRPQSRSVQAARPDQNGRYQLRGLPAGEYLLAAVAHVEQGEWFDPAFLEPLRAGAVRILLNDGETKTTDLKLITPQ